MVKDLKFKAEDIKCNGNIGGCTSVLSAGNRSLLSAFIKTHFMQADQGTILQELEDSGILTDNWIVGNRAGSIEEIINRMSSGLVSYGIYKFAQNGGTYKAHRELSEMWVNAQVKMMTAKDIITIMESALMDCATADYWYTYEKEWN